MTTTIYTIEDARHELAKLVRRAKPYSKQYLHKLIQNRELIPLVPHIPWLITVDELARYAEILKKRARKDNRSIRYFDQNRPT